MTRRLVLGSITVAVAATLIGCGTMKVYRIDKVEFSVCAAPTFTEIYEELVCEQWVVVGVEAHVCVYQTVRDLIDHRADVYVPVDAVLSRSEENRRVGLDLMERCGAITTSTETIIFDVLRKAGTDDFKALSKLIR